MIGTLLTLTIHSERPYIRGPYKRAALYAEFPPRILTGYIYNAVRIIQLCIFELRKIRHML